LVLSTLYGQWLVDRERSKGTLAWVRSLPYSDAEIVFGKFAAYYAMQSTVFVAGSLLSAPMEVAKRPEGWLLTWLAILAFGALLMTGKWLFGEKLGQAAAGIILLGIVVGLAKATAAVSKPQVASAWIYTLLLPCLLMSIVGLPFLVSAIVGRQDTSEWAS
jgi:ABC-2 family transporter protein